MAIRLIPTSMTLNSVIAFILCFFSLNSYSFARQLRLGLPPVPDFPGCPVFAPCCPTSREDQPRDAKCPGFQGAVKMTIIMK